MAGGSVWGGGWTCWTPNDRDASPMAWPVLRTHPETGRRSLCINPHHFLRCVGTDEAEGDALFEELRSRMPSTTTNGASMTM